MGRSKKALERKKDTMKHVPPVYRCKGCGAYTERTPRYCTCCRPRPAKPSTLFYGHRYWPPNHNDRSLSLTVWSRPVHKSRIEEEIDDDY